MSEIFVPTQHPILLPVPIIYYAIDITTCYTNIIFSQFCVTSVIGLFKSSLHLKRMSECYRPSIVGIAWLTAHTADKALLFICCNIITQVAIVVADKTDLSWQVTSTELHKYDWLQLEKIWLTAMTSWWQLRVLLGDSLVTVYVRYWWKNKKKKCIAEAAWILILPNTAWNYTRWTLDIVPWSSVILSDDTNLVGLFFVCSDVVIINSTQLNR